LHKVIFPQLLPAHQMSLNASHLRYAVLQNFVSAKIKNVYTLYKGVLNITCESYTQQFNSEYTVPVPYGATLIQNVKFHKLKYAGFYFICNKILSGHQPLQNSVKNPCFGDLLVF
jgi:hypothetical protein